MPPVDVSGSCTEPGERHVPPGFSCRAGRLNDRKHSKYVANRKRGLRPGASYRMKWADMSVHGAALLSAVLAVCTSSAWAVSAAPAEPVPVLPASECLPMEKMLAEQWEEAIPRTLEECDRYLAAGRLANDPCVLKTEKDGLGLVPAAAWEEEEGWKAMQVHLDGALTFIFFDEAGIPEPFFPGLCRVTVDHRSSTVVRLGYGAWQAGPRPCTARPIALTLKVKIWGKFATFPFRTDGTSMSGPFPTSLRGCLRAGMNPGLSPASGHIPAIPGT